MINIILYSIIAVVALFVVLYIIKRVAKTKKNKNSQERKELKTAIQQSKPRRTERFTTSIFIYKLPTVANKNFCAASRQRNSPNRLMSNLWKNTLLLPKNTTEKTSSDMSLPDVNISDSLEIP